MMARYHGSGLCRLALISPFYFIFAPMVNLEPVSGYQFLAVSAISS